MLRIKSDPSPVTLNSSSEKTSSPSSENSCSFEMSGVNSFRSLCLGTPSRADNSFQLMYLLHMSSFITSRISLCDCVMRSPLSTGREPGYRPTVLLIHRTTPCRDKGPFVLYCNETLCSRPHPQKRAYEMPGATSVTTIVLVVQRVKAVGEVPADLAPGESHLSELVAGGNGW